jgi:hypothetical protein
MSVAFSEYPGRHERHYRRRLENALFGARALGRDDARLLEMQRLDHEELLAFIAELRETVQQAVDLKPNEGSDVVLALKERLDRLYEQSAGLADRQADNQAAIAQLIEVIMRNVERGAAGDAQAVAELDQERRARAAHFALLREPLVADLLHPDSTIPTEDLAATLLSAGQQALRAALELFDAAQLEQVRAAAVDCLGRAGDSESAKARLQQISERLAELRGAAPLN